jgi:peptidoglycan/xylan/chitin deacetylase (PgdA/CDA1 family)
MMDTQDDHLFGILMYHRVAPAVAGVARPTWNVPPERFRRQLTGLLARGYQAWPLHRVLQHRAAGKPIPRRTFVVTFDDGYGCIYRNAWPILRELAIPATIFLVTSYLDAEGPMSCDDWTAAGAMEAPRDAWRPLSTVECEQMLESGLIELGSHTHEHRDYRGRSTELQSDLVCSAEVLRKSFGLTKPAFAFPYGYFDSDLVAVVRRSGMGCALAVDQDIVRPGTDPFAWGRLTAQESDTVWTLDFKLNGWYTALRGAWQWLRGISHRADGPATAPCSCRSPEIERRSAISQ